MILRATVLRRQTGMTLVEIMVAMVAGIILMAGAFQVFMSTKQTYRVQESLSRLQENGRFAAMQLTDDMRMAGFAGCITGVNNLLDPTGAGYDAILFDPARAIYGWEAAGTAPGNSMVLGDPDPAGVAINDWQDSNGNDLPAYLADLVVPGSDVILVKRAEQLAGISASGNTPANAATINLTGPSGLAKFSLVLVTDCAGADLFQNTQAATGSTLTRGAGGDPGNLPPGSNFFSHQYSGDMQIFSYAVDVYFVGIGVAGRPSLFRTRFGGGTGGLTEELVEGIDNLQWLYGEDTDLDRSVDAYVTADAVTDWSRVIAIRAAMLVTSVNSALRESRSAAFQVNALELTPPADRRQRQVFTTTIALRNRLP